MSKYEFTAATATAEQKRWRGAVNFVIDRARGGNSYETLFKRMVKRGADAGYARHVLDELGMVPKSVKPVQIWRPAPIGHPSILLGTACRREDGWRFIPNVSGRRPSRKAHASLVRCLPAWVTRGPYVEG